MAILYQYDPEFFSPVSSYIVLLNKYLREKYGRGRLTAGQEATFRGDSKGIFNSATSDIMICNNLSFTLSFIFFIFSFLLFLFFLTDT